MRHRHPTGTIWENQTLWGGECRNRPESAYPKAGVGIGQGHLDLSEGAIWPRGNSTRSDPLYDTGEGILMVRTNFVVVVVAIALVAVAVGAGYILLTRTPSGQPS